MTVQTIEVSENNKLIERKHFLMRGLALGNVSQETYDAEVPELTKKILLNTQRRLESCEKELHDEITKVKQSVSSDGDMKRSVANLLIKFLSPDFTKEEVRGILRQGYKIMRGK